VKALPEEFDAGALADPLADGWGFDLEAADYAPLGIGSYHWVVRDREGTRGFVTVDDLDRKSWLGDTRESAFDGLQRAFDTAIVLRGSGLGFVVAPVPTRLGESLRRMGPQHSIALFPLVDGQPRDHGEYDAVERLAVVAMLAELHQATPAVASLSASVGLELPGRRHLEAGLREQNQTWVGGPFSERARHVLAAHASGVTEAIASADRLAADVASRRGQWVVTHGEPHAGNVMRTGERQVLVDWDTVALAPPERDLWMVVGDSAAEAALYAEATGRQVDDVAVSFFRLTWDLKDLAEWLNVLRSPHRETEDTVNTYEGLTNLVALLGQTRRPERRQHARQHEQGCSPDDEPVGHLDAP
jgi:spectinomycin phosphotransferase